MNYKLAKELKEAGFPRTDGGWIKRKGKKDWIPATGLEMSELTFTGDEEDTKTPNPTLSELIDACGDYVAVWGKNSDGSYGANKMCDDGDVYKDAVYGKSPEEAVAKLWLKLKKKDLLVN